MWSLADTRMTGNTWQAHTRALASRLVKGSWVGVGVSVWGGGAVHRRWLSRKVV